MIKGKDVLLIDDDPHAAGAVRAVLESLGHLVTVCADSEEALRCSVGRVFDCIITDLDMPGMNGLEAAKRMRQQFPAAYLIAVSSADLCDAFLFAGANWFIHKPVTPSKLQPIFGSRRIQDVPAST